MGRPWADRERLADRDRRVWSAYLAGRHPRDLAAEEGVSERRVRQILEEIRKSVPEVDRAQLVLREAEFLDSMRAKALEIASEGPVPLYSQGRPVLLADGSNAQDHSGELAAMDRAMRSHERLAKLLGLEAPAKADVTVSTAEFEATKEAAEAALAYLAGEGSLPLPGGSGVEEPS